MLASFRWAGRKRGALLVLGLSLVGGATVVCGRAITEIPSIGQASGARAGTPSPSGTVTSPIPAFAFGPSDCVAPASGVVTEPLGADRVLVNIPPGWTRVPQGGLGGTVVLDLAAPVGYANRPTTIKVQSFVGNYYGKTAHDWAAFWIQRDPSAEQTIVDCSVAGGTAAIMRYAYGDFVGYRALLIRVDQKIPQFAREWGLTIEGTGGLDANSIADAKKVLGSWRWDG